MCKSRCRGRRGAILIEVVIASAFHCSCNPPSPDLETTDSPETTGATDDPDADTDTGGGTTASPTPVCGDGVVQDGEACDDGDEQPGDGCESDCVLTSNAEELWFDCASASPGYHDDMERGVFDLAVDEWGAVYLGGAEVYYDYPYDHPFTREWASANTLAIKWSADGQPQWTQASIPGDPVVGGVRDDLGMSSAIRGLAPDASGGFFAAGNALVSAGADYHRAAWLQRHDQAGAAQGPEIIVDMDGEGTLHDAIVDSQENVVVVGVSDGATLLAKYTGGGEHIWTLNTPPAAPGTGAHQVELGLDDTTYTLVSDSQSRTAHIVKHDADGSLLWTLAVLLEADDAIYEFTLAPADDLLVTGRARYVDVQPHYSLAGWSGLSSVDGPEEATSWQLDLQLEPYNDLVDIATGSDGKIFALIVGSVDWTHDYPRLMRVKVFNASGEEQRTHYMLSECADSLIEARGDEVVIASCTHTRTSTVATGPCVHKLRF